MDEARLGPIIQNPVLRNWVGRQSVREKRRALVWFSEIV